MNFTNQRLLNLLEHRLDAVRDDARMIIQPGQKTSMSYDDTISESRDE